MTLPTRSVKELDFTRDGRNADRMSTKLPRCIRVSGSRKFTGNTPPLMLMVMDYIEGVRIDDPEAIAAMGLDPHEIGVNGIPCLPQDDLRGRFLPR